MSVIGEEGDSLPRQRGTYVMIPVDAFCVDHDLAKTVCDFLDVITQVMFGSSSRDAA
jgi:hypothetical protein